MFARTSETVIGVVVRSARVALSLRIDSALLARRDNTSTLQCRHRALDSVRPDAIDRDQLGRELVRRFLQITGERA